MVYAAKVDWWVGWIAVGAGVLLAAVGTLLLSVAVNEQIIAPAAVGAVQLAIGVGLLVCYFTTTYTLSDADLVIRFGPVRRRVPLDRIAGVSRRWGVQMEMCWNFTWSLDRIVIHRAAADGRPALFSISIAPADADGFLGELAALRPDLALPDGRP